MIAGSNSQRTTLLQDAPYDLIESAIVRKLISDREDFRYQLAELAGAQESLSESRRNLEAAEQRLFAPAPGSAPGDVIELNVGGKHMSTTREVLLSAGGSLLAGMFSGNFDGKLKRDRDQRFFLDVDPNLFAKILSHLRLRRIAGPECPAPLPQVGDELRAEYDILVRHFGLEPFFYGAGGQTGNIFQNIATLLDVDQSRLQASDAIRILLSSTGGVPSANHEEVLGFEGFQERSVENSYGTQQNTITIKFLKHRVRVEAMELRAKWNDVVSHMTHEWTFRHGSEHIHMVYQFSKTELCSGRMPILLTGGFVDEIAWLFVKDYCLEHIVLYGRVTPK